MALWVFISHVLYTSDIHLPILSEGGLAVHVFMILSGFVIARLCMHNSEPYLFFLMRRLARLYPAYLIALGVGITVSSMASSLYTALPWQVTDYERLTNRHALEQAHFMPLLLGHLSLLHGVFPEEILPGSSLAFVPAAWSLSLEWQFYLFAPLLIWLLMSRRYVSVVIIGTIINQLAMKHIAYHFTYIVPGFLPLGLAYFVVGIVSAFVFDSMREAHKHILVWGGGRHHLRLAYGRYFY